MTIGIGGAGSKLAMKLDSGATLVNVSQGEMDKLLPEKKILAVNHAAQGQLRGSRKDPSIGLSAFQSIRAELLPLIRGNIVFSSTGGGTGTGISTGLLQAVAEGNAPELADRTTFVFVLPHAEMEAGEYVKNTTEFLQGALSEAVDSGNSGNIILMSNRVKFESRLPEDEFNDMLIDSLKTFLAIPGKNDELKLLDGHIDWEDFNLFKSKPYFNHFTAFDFNPDVEFEKQLDKHLNPLLLAAENPIEAMFLLEVPEGGDPRSFYDILDYFQKMEATPVYSVVENPAIKKPFVTVSMLYSRKPAELVEDFNRITVAHAKTKVRKTLDQYVTLQKLHVNMESEVKKVAKQKGSPDGDILTVLRRIGKL